MSIGYGHFIGFTRNKFVPIWHLAKGNWKKWFYHRWVYSDGSGRYKSVGIRIFGFEHQKLVELKLDYDQMTTDNLIHTYAYFGSGRRGNSGRCYTKEQIAEIRKTYLEGELDALPYIGYNTESIEIGDGRKFQFGRLWKKVEVDEKIDLTVTMSNEQKRTK